MRLTWLEHPPKIKLLRLTDARKPYPLSWEEQARLFRKLPDHLARMALFKVNTGCREQEVCSLRWEWEIKVPELDTSVFLMPEEWVKNGEERLVVLNRVARSVIESARGVNRMFVFTYCGKQVGGAGVSEPVHAVQLDAGTAGGVAHRQAHHAGLEPAALAVEQQRLLVDSAPLD